MVNFLTKFKCFDAYPKPLDDFRIKTFTGALITSVTIIIVLILFFYEWISYKSIEINQELFVDLTRQQKLTINLDLTFQRLHCSLLSLDAMDISGEHQNDVIKGLKKFRIDKMGKIIQDVNEQILTTILSTVSSSIENKSLDLPQCLSCYGAESSKIPCCNTCEDVKTAYRQKNWHFSPFEIKQCKETLSEASRNVKASVKSEDFETIRKLIETDEGCKLQGHLEVNKVAGNFHVAPGISYQHEHTHIHDIKNMPIEKFNTAHYFDVFSFGDEYPNQFNPLERKNFKPKENIVDKKNFNKMENSPEFEIFKFFQDSIFDRENEAVHSISYNYFLKVVPTTYEYQDGRIINNTYQYSVTRSTKLINGNNMFGSQLPGIFVNYELSPIMIKYKESSKSFIHFITGCCAIIGGLFTIAGMFDTLLFRYFNMLKKYQINKLT